MKFNKHTVATLSTFLFMLPLQVFSAEEQTSNTVKTAAALNADPMSGGYLAQLVIGLFIVLFCIVVLAWFAKKMNRFNSLADGSLKVIGGLSMGSRERVALLQVGDQQLLIGISPGRINTLHVLDTPLEMNDTASDHATDNAGTSNIVDKFKAAMNDASKTSLKKK